MGIPSWLVGAIINVVGNVMISLGQNLMKLGMNQRRDLDMEEDKKPKITKFKWWWIGLVTFGIGTLANFASFGFAAQSLLAALGSVQFVCALVFSSLVLKERITAYSLVSVVFIIGGCLLLVIFGNHESTTYTVDQLKDLYSNIPYIIYLVVGAIMVFGSYIVYLHGMELSQQGLHTSTWVRLTPVAYSLFSALIGTQSVIFSKSLSVLLVMTIDGHNQLGNWYTWVTLVVFIIAAAYWVVRLNQGLGMFPVMVISPMMQICWIILSTVSGMLYFQEYKGFTALMGAMFGVGMIIILVGVFLLTLHARRVELLAEVEVQLQLETSKASFMTANPAYDGGSHARTYGSSRGATGEEHPELLGETVKARSFFGATMLLSQGMGTTLPSGAELRRARLAAAAEVQRRSELNWSAVRGGGAGGVAGSADFNASAASSMMSTLQRGARRAGGDWKLFDGPRARAAIADGSFAVSVFGLPTAAELNSSHARHTTRSSAGGDGDGGEHGILSALPQSRFYHAPDAAADAHALETIRETPSESVLGKPGSSVGAAAAAAPQRGGSPPDTLRQDVGARLGAAEPGPEGALGQAKAVKFQRLSSAGDAAARSQLSAASIPRSAPRTPPPPQHRDQGQEPSAAAAGRAPEDGGRRQGRERGREADPGLRSGVSSPRRPSDPGGPRAAAAAGLGGGGPDVAGGSGAAGGGDLWLPLHSPRLAQLQLQLQQQQQQQVGLQQRPQSHHWLPLAAPPWQAPPPASSGFPAAAGVRASWMPSNRDVWIPLGAGAADPSRWSTLHSVQATGPPPLPLPPQLSPRPSSAAARLAGSGSPTHASSYMELLAHGAAAAPALGAPGAPPVVPLLAPRGSRTSVVLSSSSSSLTSLPPGQAAQMLRRQSLGYGPGAGPPGLPSPSAQERLLYQQHRAVVGLQGPGLAWSDSPGYAAAEVQQVVMMRGRPLTPPGSGGGSGGAGVSRIGAVGNPGAQRPRTPQHLSISRSWVARDRQ